MWPPPDPDQPGAGPPPDPAQPDPDQPGAGPPNGPPARPPGEPPPPPPGEPAPRKGPNPLLIGGLAGLGVLIVGLIVLLAVMGGDGDDDVTTVPGIPSSTTAPASTPTTTSAPPSSTAAPTPSTTEPPSTTVAGPPSVDDIARAVVQIMLLDGNGDPVCTGSGSVISGDGRILTNAHVVENIEPCLYETIGVAVTERTDEPPNLLYAADLLAIDRALDLAVVRISGTLTGRPLEEELPTLAIGDSETVALGDTVRIFGFPGIGGETVTLTAGSVSGYVSEAAFGPRAWIKTDATIAGGNSGGAAVDEAGELVGVPTQAGAGDSEVVDCRIITDSNGDGLVDAADTCVPLGGFINGLRPIRLAADLIRESETADPIPVAPPPTTPSEFDPLQVSASDLTMSTGVTEDGNPIDEALYGPTGSTDLCFFFSYAGMADGVLWDGIWLYEGEPDDGASLIGQVWNGGESGAYYVCIGNPDGLAAGLYELVFVVEGETVFGEAAYVGGEPREPIDIVLRNVSGTTVCYVEITPGAAGYWGLDDLGPDEVVADGEERVFTVISGNQAVRARDCDGNELYGDPDGAELTASTVIEVTG